MRKVQLSPPVLAACLSLAVAMMPRGASVVAMPQEGGASSAPAADRAPSQSTTPPTDQNSATAAASGQSTAPKAPATATNPQSVAPPMPTNDSYWDPDWGPRRTFKASKAAPQFTGTYQSGSVFVSDGSGSVDIFQPDGTMIGTLSTGQPLSAGMAFDRSGNLYVTTFGLPTGVVKFDVNGNLVGPFGSFPASATGNSYPESVLVSTSGTVFVGAATLAYVCPGMTSGPEPAFEFSPSGSLLNTFTVAGECRGTDWIELLPDQVTLLYTSEGTSVKSFNIGTNTQNPNFAANLPGASAFAFRELPDGTVLVADSTVAVRLGTDGTVLTTYQPSAAPATIFALNLDPDGTSFWTADLDTGTVYRFDIASGTQLSTFVSPTGFASGLAVFGEKIVGNNNLTVTINGSGAGTVTSSPAGISCPTTCFAPFPDNSSVTLTATPSAGSTLASFSPNCVPASPQTSPPTCSVPIGTSDVTVTSTFSLSVAATISIAPATLTFGSQAVGTTSAAQTVTVTNTSESTVTFTNIVTTGDFAGATLAQCPSIAVGGTPCTLHITFTPTATGTRSGAITFTDNATGSPQSVILAGTGTSSSTTIGITPTSLTFGSQAVGTTSPAQMVTVSNTGGNPLTFTSITTSGDFAGATLAQCPSIAVEAEPCVFSITFKPTVTGTRTGTITFTDNATGSPQTVTLTGTGTSAAATVTVTPSSLTFGSQTVGTTSAPLSVTVTNTSTASVTFAGFTISGANAENFGTPLPTSGTMCSPTGTLAAGASCTINVLFTPGANGTFTATLNIADNATGSPQMVALSGTGVTSQVAITVPPGGSTTATTVPGGTAYFGLMISGAPGVKGTVQLGCVPSSVVITCNVIPATVTLNGGTTEIAFGIQSFCQGTTPATGMAVPGGMGGGLGMLLVTMMLGGAVWTFRRKQRVALTFATLLMVALGSAACNSLPQGPNGATPPGTYNLSLTTTFNGQTQTLPNFLTLVVK